MMLWEHVVVGYVGYSLFVHAVSGESPTGRETIVVVLAAILPDAVDKPLGWEFGLFPTGYGVGHSIFVAVAVSIGVGVLAHRRDRPRIGWAFAIGYLLHLLGDVAPEYVFDGRVVAEQVLWPVHLAQRPVRDGMMEGIVRNVDYYLYSVLGPSDPTQAITVNAVLAFGVWLWVYDGMPAVR